MLEFLHQLGAIVWFGGVLAINVLQVRFARSGDGAGQASLLHLTDLYGRTVIAPAAVITLISGLFLAPRLGLSLRTLWVAWGLAGVVLSLVIGATLLRVTNAELRRLAADAALGDPRWSALQRRIATLYGINLVVLLSVVWAMIFKPTL